METSRQPKPISIGNPQTGISDSPVSGWYDLRNVNVDDMPGVAQINFRLNRQTKLAYSTPFTANTGSNIIVFTDDTTTTGVANGIETVQFTTTGTLPTGLSLSTNYWLNANYPGKVYSSWYNALNNSPVTISTTGSGVHTLTYVVMTGTPHLYYDETNNYLFAITSTGQIWINYNLTTFGLITGNALTSYDTMIYWKGYYWFIGSQGIEANKFIGNPSGSFVSVINSTYGYLINGGGVWAGAYSSSNNYTIGQIVSYSGSYYLCIIANGAGSIVKAPTDISYWVLTTTWDTTYPKKCFLSQNNRLYITNGLNVIEIKENLNKILDLGTPATFNYNYGVFSTSIPYKSTVISEYNGLMYIGTDNKYIYTWDRSSLTWDMGATLPEKYTYWLVNANNTLYIGAGTNGIIYYSNGVSVQTIKQIPSHLYSKYYTSFSKPLLFSEAVVIKNSIIYPITISGGTGAVFSYNTLTGVLTIFNEVANIHYPYPGVYNRTLTFSSIVAINTIDYFTAYTYYDVGGSPIPSVDSNILRTTAQRVIGNGTLYNPYFASLSSAIMKVGINDNRKSFNHLDVELNDLFTDGQGIAQYWRENQSDTYNLLKDINFGGYTTYTATPTDIQHAPTKSYTFDFGIVCESFQTKTVLYSGASDSQKLTSPKFKTITIL